MKTLFKKSLLVLMMFACLIVCVAVKQVVSAEETTYTFTSKAWLDSTNSWKSGKDGNQLTSGRGVQVTKTLTGANATSNNEFDNVSKIIFTYSTNASSGAGSIVVKVGNNSEISKSVTNTGGTTDRTIEFSDINQSGKITFTVNCTTNSIYIKSVKVITVSAGLSDEEQVANILGNISLEKEYQSDFELNSSGVWEVISGTGVEIEDGVAKVTPIEVDQEVTLKVTVTSGEVSDSKEFNIVIPGKADYSYEFTSTIFAELGSVMLNNVEWNLNGEGTGYFGYDSTKGQQLGSGGNPFKSMTLSTSGIAGTIDKIVVNTSGASGIQGTFSVKVNNDSYLSGETENITLTSTATKYTFVGNSKGEIILLWEQTSSKGLYIKSIEVWYTLNENEKSITYVLDGGSNPDDAINSYTEGIDSLVLPIPTKYGYKFEGWYDNEELNGDSFVSLNKPTGNITVYAKWTEEVWHPFVELNTIASLAVKYTSETSDVSVSNGYKYVKVTEEQVDWSGTYLIVYENGNNAYIFNGVDAVNGYVTATISDNTINYSDVTSANELAIDAITNGYSVKHANGYLYGSSKSNKLSFNVSQAQLNTIAYDNVAKCVKITSGRVLRFNSASDQMRFRYYTDGSQQPVQLYKKVATTSTEVTEFEFEKVTLRFGLSMPIEVYNSLGEDVTFGIAYQKGATFDAKTATHFECNNIAEVDDEMLYNIVLPDVPNNAYLTEVSACAYVIIDGEYYYAKPKSYSVKSIAKNYIDNKATDKTVQEHLAMLTYLASITE